MRPEMYPPTPPQPVRGENIQPTVPALAKGRYARQFVISSIVTYGLIALLFVTPFVLGGILPSSNGLGNLIYIILAMLTVLVVAVVAGIIMIVIGTQYLRYDRPTMRARIGTITVMSVYVVFILFIVGSIAMNT